MSAKLSKFSKLKFILVAAILILPQFIFGTSTSSVQAATNPTELSNKIEQVKKEREALIEEQRRLQQELENINKQTRTLGSAVKSLDAARKKLTADINLTQSKISSTNLAINKLEGTMEEKKYQIDAHKKAISDTLAILSERDKKPLLMSLLASVRLADIWGDTTRLEDLNSKLQSEIINLREAREALVEEKEEKEKIVKEQAYLKSQLDGQKSVIEENQKAKEKLLAETKNTEAAYQRMLEENLRRQEEFEADLFKLESELRIAIDPTLLPIARPGVLSWPLDKVFITQQFGKTSASGRLYASGSHNGVDFRAVQGTPVKVMLSGVVEGTGNTDEQKGCYSYGRWILVKHGNGLSSIYSHLSASLAKTGQKVETGEVIGYSGGMPRVFGSGYSTGPHLHAGLFASQGVSVQQFVSSKHCKEVFVPIVDVKAYLDPITYLPRI